VGIVPPDAASPPAEITLSKKDAPIAKQTPPKPKKRPGLPQLENRKVLILEMPARKRRKQQLFQMDEVPEEQVIKQYSYLLVFEEKADAFQLAIDMMRPSNPQVDPSDLGTIKNVVSRKRFQQIQLQLKTQFNRLQLLGYVNTVHEAEHTQPVSKGTVKWQLIEHILKVLWKVEISEEIHERMDFIVEKKLAMSKEDIFFLISQSMQILYLPHEKTMLTKKMQTVEIFVYGLRITLLVLQSTFASPHCLLRPLW